MGRWLSSCVKKQPGLREALSDLVNNIHEYKDAAKPSACRESGGSFWSPELMLFRPDWRIFTLISVVYGITGIIFSWIVSDYPVDKWADLLGKWTDLSLLITVQVFVLGISVVAIAQSVSEEGSFIGEYINDSCRTPWFCCLTLIAVLCGVVGHFVVSTVEDIQNVVIVGICMASVGAAIDCLAMLAFVILETIRCSMPSETIKVVSRYAARKLTYGYVNDSYVKLFYDQQKSYLKEWCAGKAIHPPSQCCIPYIHSDSADKNVEIELNRDKSGKDVYKDYDLKGLEELDKYLKENNAKLYLSSPFFESEQNVLGVLVCENEKPNEKLKSEVRKRGEKATRYRQHKFSEMDEDFWDSQESKINEAIERAVDKADPIQAKAYLDAVNVPLSVLRQIRKKHKVVRDAYGEHIGKGYQFLRLYLRALREIINNKKSDQAYKLARKVRKSVWEETKNILREIDYHSIELYTWLAQQMYALIQNAGDKAENLQEMRGQFGGFYEFAGVWLEDSESKNAEDVNKMRLVLQEGLTKWLLAAVKKKDGELIEQLCDAGRKIVFGREQAIKFDNKKAVAQHFVLAGWLISQAKSGKVNTSSVERMFYERHSNNQDVNFDELVGFYLDAPLSPGFMDSYLRIFYSPTQTHTDLLTGSLSSSGFGMIGHHQMALAFIFLAAHVLKTAAQLPPPIACLSGKINDNDIDIVSEVFRDPGIRHGCTQLKKLRKSCEELDETEEDKEIAGAALDPAKVKEWETEFWEGYSRAVPVLSMCLKNGNYEIDENVKNKQYYRVPKIALFNWKYPISGASGNDYGFPIGHGMEGNVLNAIIEDGDAESKIEGGLANAIGEAAKWLEKEGCSKEEGIIIAVSEEFPEVVLYEDKDFTPSWQEDVRSSGFEGFYRDFPIVRLRENKEEEGEEEKEKKPQCQKVVAVDMRGWVGLRVRKEIVTDRRFGELKIKKWKDEEIKQAIDSGKLDAKDADKAKGNCPVNVTFFWESIKENLPKTRTFKFDSLKQEK